MVSAVTPLPQVYTGKVHLYRLQKPVRWPVRVHCGEWIDEHDKDRVTDDLKKVPEARRCRRCLARQVTSDRSKLQDIAQLARTAGEGGTVSVDEVLAIIEARTAARAS